MLAALLTCFWPLRLLRFYPGLVLLFCGWIVLYFYAACTAQLARMFNGHPTFKMVVGYRPAPNVADP